MCIIYNNCIGVYVVWLIDVSICVCDVMCRRYLPTAAVVASESFETRKSGV